MDGIIDRSFLENRKTSRAYAFYLSLTEKYFAPMQHGQLQITFPQGEVMRFGSGAGQRANIRINNLEFFRKGLLYGDVGFGEAYVDGDWDTDSVKDVISWMLLNLENHASLSGSGRSLAWVNIFRAFNKLYHTFRNNSIGRSRKNIAEHYDLSNDFFATFLDPTMTYSCAYFGASEGNLEEAQTAKYDLLCKKLRLKPEDHLLEIGSGWGGFAIHAAKKYGCRITTITISKEQFEHARTRFEKEKLNGQIEIRLQDYRKVTGKFDKIASIEMLEAVGHKYLSTFFGKCHDLLKRNGLLGLQVITCPDSRYDILRKNVDWIQKHIFPGSLLPSVAVINQTINKTGDAFLHHLEDMGLHYAKTLATWRENFNHNLAQIRSMGFNEAFIRKWNYYLSYCEAAFTMRNITVTQLIYTRPNNLQL